MKDFDLGIEKHVKK